MIFRALAVLLCTVPMAPAYSQVAVAVSVSDADPLAVQVRSADGFTLFDHGFARPVLEWDETLPAHNAVSATASSPCTSRIVPPYVPGLAKSAAMRRLKWWTTVSETECLHGLPTGLLDAVILQESRYSPLALSPAGAAGLAQLMPGTASDLRVSDRFDPMANIDGGGRYLKAMLRKFGSIPIALAAYNAGPGSVSKARGGIPRNGETPDYVRSVLGYWSFSSADPVHPLRQTAEILGFVTPD